MSYEITIYTTKTCPYCIRAKELLKSKGVEKFVKEIDVTDNSELRALMAKRANERKTVPQIFIGDRHIGGFDDLYALDHTGELDKLLEKFSAK